MAKEGLERLWGQLDGIKAEMVRLEAREVEVLRKIRAEQGVEGPEAAGGVTLADMEDPVSCVDVGDVVRKRSDRVAEMMQRRGYVIVQKARTYYCQAKDAAALWGKFRRHWEAEKVRGLM